MAAIEKAYTSYIAHEAFPTCVLFLDMNPSIVDVNVHPAKLEVKFANEQPIFEAIYYTVKRAIEDHEYRPELVLSQKDKGEKNPLGAFVAIGEDTKGKQISFANTNSEPKTSFSFAGGAKPSYSSVSLGSYKKPESFDYSKPLKVASPVGSIHSEPRQSELSPKNSLDILKRYSESEASPTLIPSIQHPPVPKTVSEPEIQVEEEIEYKYIGEAFNCYLLCEYEGAMLVIDKHAAHERVIFEDLKAISERDGRVASQSLLLPITVMLSPNEIECAREYKDELCAVGFDFDVLTGCVNLMAIPSSIGSMEAESLFAKMIDDIMDGKGNPEITEKIRREQALYQIACKAAIKGGRIYDRSVSEWIIKKVLSLPDVIVCPHGRPIAYKLTKSELDRQFERIK